MSHPTPTPSSGSGDAADLLAFWRGAGPDRWFKQDAAFDALFRERFGELHFAAARRDCDGWIDHADSALALVLLLDQFPRNAFRGTGHMFATDPLARLHARRAIAVGHDQQTAADLRIFFYLPFAHSEDLHDQDLSVERHHTLGAQGERHALGHGDIIQRFGRFPHRNAALGRASCHFVPARPGWHNLFHKRMAWRARQLQPS